MLISKFYINNRFKRFLFISLLFCVSITLTGCKVAEIFEKIGSFVKNVFDKIGNLFSKVKKVVEPIKNTIDSTKKIIDAGKSFGETIKNVGKEVKNIFSGSKSSDKVTITSREGEAIESESAKGESSNQKKEEKTSTNATSQKVEINKIESKNLFGSIDKLVNDVNSIISQSGKKLQELEALKDKVTGELKEKIDKAIEGLKDIKQNLSEFKEGEFKDFTNSDFAIKEAEKYILECQKKLQNINSTCEAIAKEYNNTNVDNLNELYNDYKEKFNIKTEQVKKNIISKIDEIKTKLGQKNLSSEAKAEIEKIIQDLNRRILAVNFVVGFSMFNKEKELEISSDKIDSSKIKDIMMTNFSNNMRSLIEIEVAANKIYAKAIEIINNN